MACICSPGKFIERMQKIARQKDLAAVGTVIQPWQLGKQSIRDHVLNPTTVPKILLFRANTVERVISDKRHGLMKKMTRQKAYEKVLRLSKKEILHEARRWKKWFEFLESELVHTGQLVYTLHYESLLFQSSTNLFFILDQLRRFIGISAPSSSPKLTKTKSASSCSKDNVVLPDNLTRAPEGSSLISLPYLSRCPV